MITVAHLDHTTEPGGAELALARLIEDNPGWSPALYVPPAAGSELGAFSTTYPAVVHEVGVAQPAGAIGGDRRAQLRLLSRVLRQAFALRFDKTFRGAHVVHANTSRAALIGWLACVGSDRRLVVHLRDAIDSAALGQRNAKLLSMVVSRAAGIIANSEYTLETATPFINVGTPARVIPSPIGLVSARSPARSAESVRVIGMLARITEWKGQELLIRAFAKKFRGSRIILELAGSPAFGQEDYLTYLHELVRELGVVAQVRFLGHVSDIWPLLDSWDVCVQASLHNEPMGQNVLQYLAACRPTVAAKAGGPTEWIKHGETGLLFEPGDEDSLGLALSKLVEERSFRSSLSNALSQVRPVPTDDEVRRLHAQFFEEVWASPR